MFFFLLEIHDHDSNVVWVFYFLMTVYKTSNSKLVRKTLLTILTNNLILERGSTCSQKGFILYGFKMFILPAEVQYRKKNNEFPLIKNFTLIFIIT